MRHRPQIHFTAKAGWINDPLALTWRDGTYHVFFQYVPGRTTWAPNCHWGHATSPDLLHWQEQPVALAPGDGDDGVWSGSIAHTDDGSDVMFYTAVTKPDTAIGRIRLATPQDPDWQEWRKGPVVADAPRGADVAVYRDPFVFRDGDCWRMLVGAGLTGGVAAALTYTSPDLLSWQYDGIAAHRPSSLTDPLWTGAMWECPQLLSIDGRHVLITSVWENDVLHHVVYAVGTWADGRFTARSWRQLTFGTGYYAPSMFYDRAGRPGLVFWIRNLVSADGQSWAGALSLPHLLSLRGDTLIARPHPNADDLRAGLEIYHVDQRQMNLSGNPTSLHWSGQSTDLSIQHQDAQIQLRRTNDLVHLHVNGEARGALPTMGDPITITVDETVLEISTGVALLATALPI